MLSGHSKQEPRLGHSRHSSASSTYQGSLSFGTLSGEGLFQPSPHRVSVTSRDAHLGMQLQGIVPLLNNPRDAGSTWFANPFGESFPETPPPLPTGLLPEVTIKQFQRYLKREAVSYQRFLGTHDHDRDDPPATADGEGLRQAMQHVPPMFFQEAFSLSRPQTWDEIAPSDTEEQRTQALEQLSQHLDVVEGHLLNDISAKRENFFEAASVLADLRGALYRAFSLVSGLRKQMGSMGEEASMTKAQLYRLSTRRDNLAALVSRLSTVDALSSGVQALELMLQSSNYPAALDVLADLHEGLIGDPARGLTCCQHVPEQVSEAAAGVDQMLLADFLGVTAITDVSRATDGALAALRAARLRGSPSTSELALDAFAGVWNGPAEADAGLDASREEVAMLVACLRRTGRLEEALTAARDAAAAEGKLAVREVVERGLPLLLAASPASASSGVLTEELKALPNSGALLLLASIHAALKICLAHRSRVRAVLGDVLRAQRVPRQEAAALLAIATDAMQAACDAVLGRWVKVLGARVAVQAQLSLADLREVLAMTDAAAAAGEAAGVRASAALRSAVQQLCRTWLDALHTRSMQQLRGMLEREVWAAVSVPPGVQATVDGLAQRALPEALRVTPSPLSKTVKESALERIVESNSVNGRKAATEVVRLHIGDQAFCMVAVALQAIMLAAEYLKFQQEAPAFSGDVARRVVELLQVFNSRSCQLVLGAGAMSSAGLRSITAKHLALAAQAAGALAALHPLLRAVLAAPVAHARRSLLSPDFDRLLQDLTVHRAEVHSKLVGIMRERLNASLKHLPPTAEQWAVGPPPPLNAPLPPPSPFAASNAKQLRILSQVLLPLLGAAELSSIFGRVAQVFAAALSDAFQRLQPQGPAWRKQATADIFALLAALRALPQGDTPGRAAALSPLSSLVADGAPFALPTEEQQAREQRQPQQSPQHPQQQQARVEQQPLPSTESQAEPYSKPASADTSEQQQQQQAREQRQPAVESQQQAQWQQVPPQRPGDESDAEVLPQNETASDSLQYRSTQPTFDRGINGNPSIHVSPGDYLLRKVSQAASPPGATSDPEASNPKPSAHHGGGCHSPVSPHHPSAPSEGSLPSTPPAHSLPHPQHVDHAGVDNDEVDQDDRSPTDEINAEECDFTSSKSTSFDTAATGKPGGVAVKETSTGTVAGAMASGGPRETPTERGARDSGSNCSGVAEEDSALQGGDDAALQSRGDAAHQGGIGTAAAAGEDTAIQDEECGALQGGEDASDGSLVTIDLEPEAAAAAAAKHVREELPPLPLSLPPDPSAAEGGGALLRNTQQQAHASDSTPAWSATSPSMATSEALQGGESLLQSAATAGSDTAGIQLTADVFDTASDEALVIPRDTSASSDSSQSAIEAEADPLSDVGGSRSELAPQWIVLPRRTPGNSSDEQLPNSLTLIGPGSVAIAESSDVIT